MTTGAATLRLRALLEQGALQSQRLEAARKTLEAGGPIGQQMVSSPTEVEAERIDVLLFRYMRLQDLIGGRLFPALLEAGAEMAVESAYIDKLRKLEQLGIISSAEHWMELRALRNQMAHDYPDSEIRLSILRNALDSVPTLLSALRATEQYARTKLGV